MGKILSYRDLVVWQKSMNLAEKVYEVTTELPAAEQWGLRFQMRKAAVSVPSNIAEGFGRGYTGDYLHHLGFSSGSLCELETQGMLCERFRFLPAHRIASMLSISDEVGKMLNSLGQGIRATGSLRTNA